MHPVLAPDNWFSDEEIRQSRAALSMIGYDDTLDTLEDAVSRPAWHARARCRGQTSTMFPSFGESSEPAKALCAGCEVVAECAEQGRDEPDGFWGGMSAGARVQARRAAS